MDVKLITIEDLNQLEKRLVEKMKILVEPNQLKAQKYLKSKEVMEMFGISHGTLQKWRNNGLIPFTKVSGVLLYKQDDIVAVLEEKKDLKGGTK